MAMTLMGCSDTDTAQSAADIAIANPAPDGGAVGPDTGIEEDGAATQSCAERSCEDGNPCTEDSCEDGVCVFNPVDGLACDDGDPCTPTDTCTGGSCVGAALDRESNICDGLDEDCDGATDEDCTYVLRGGLVGDGGAPLSVTPDHAFMGTLGAPRFIGKSSTDKYVITPGLRGPKGGSK